MPRHVKHRGSIGQSSRGVSLVETLVALVVLSVGLLGVAALLLQSVRGSRTALFRTHAVNLVSDMADRIRANANAGAAYATAQYGPNGPAAQGCAPTAAEAGANCSVVELARDDIARWRLNVRAALPGNGPNIPAAVVQYFPAGGVSAPERYSISVAWEEPGEAAALEQFSYRSDIVIMPRAAP